MAQTTLETVRSLSQTLHPSILDELGLDSTFDWYIGTAERQLGLTVTYERSGTPVPVDATIGIHVYRVLQEVAQQHLAARPAPSTSGCDSAISRRHKARRRGSRIGARPARRRRRGLGMVAMRERTELVGGSITFTRPDDGGTRVRLRVPLDALEAATDAGTESEPDGQGEHDGRGAAADPSAAYRGSTQFTLAGRYLLLNRTVGGSRSCFPLNIDFDRRPGKFVFMRGS